MSKFVWGKLPADAIDDFVAHLESLPASERPLWCVVGVDPMPFWRALLGILIGGRASMYGAWLSEERVSVARVYPEHARHDSPRTYTWDEISHVAARSGVMTDHVELTFTDGTRVRMRDAVKGSAAPFEDLVRHGPEGFDLRALSPQQITNFWADLKRAGVLAQDPLEGRFHGTGKG